MQKKLLIDASHQEETRIVLLSQEQVEEFDFESVNKKQIAGNIFLAKVTRVEPSLQAAFLDYGGNRHGFLAFSEIHPDYYQIPVADKKLLLNSIIEIEETSLNENSTNFSNLKFESNKNYLKKGLPSLGSNEVNDGTSFDDNSLEKNNIGLNILTEKFLDTKFIEENKIQNEFKSNFKNKKEIKDTKPIQIINNFEQLIKSENQKKEFVKNKYKIQEVIKVRQVLLIQVVKDERGNKGAALTTYISLAGRYCVLMPNTARGGGISRKITNIGDRKKLKEAANEFSIPDKMGLIIRTAGAKKTKTEIKKDYEYLLRQWEQIRNLTLKSIAPCPIYEEGSVIKRTIRDLYSKEISEIIVEGETGYKEAKDYMKMLMPTHSKKIKKYFQKKPIFSYYGVEDYLSGMFNPTVQLKSGGYIVIGITEALVAIDVNSGRATKESGIEETAFRTNLEAADEIARQLRMRDLAGLIVIDFIDMEERKNNTSVEKKIRDSLKNDRARIQVGKISSFGLLEMSRQRLRYGMIEATTMLCPNCHGTGLTRSSENLSLTILRKLENLELENNIKEIIVKVPAEVANYILNQKRNHLKLIEGDKNNNIFIYSDQNIKSPNYVIEINKNSSISDEELSSPKVITMDGKTSNNLTEEINQNIIKEESKNNHETFKETNTKKSKRRRRKNNKFRKLDLHFGETTQKTYDQLKDNNKNENLKSEDENIVGKVEKKHINDNNLNQNKPVKSVSSKSYKKQKTSKSDNTNLIAENPSEVLNKNNDNEVINKNKIPKNENTKKPTKKRVVKKVKEVLNENSKNSASSDIEEKNKRKTSVIRSSKSGWWARKV